jgi:hypothetical protein
MLVVDLLHKKMINITNVGKIFYDLEATRVAEPEPEPALDPYYIIRTLKNLIKLYVIYKNEIRRQQNACRSRCRNSELRLTAEPEPKEIFMTPQHWKQSACEVNPTFHDIQ